MECIIYTNKYIILYGEKRGAPKLRDTPSTKQVNTQWTQHKGQTGERKLREWAKFDLTPTTKEYYTKFTPYTQIHSRARAPAHVYFTLNKLIAHTFPYQFEQIVISNNYTKIEYGGELHLRRCWARCPLRSPCLLRCPRSAVRWSAFPTYSCRDSGSTNSDILSSWLDPRTL